MRILNGLFPGGVSALEKKGYVSVAKEQILRDPYKGMESASAEHILTADQRAAVEKIKSDRTDGSALARRDGERPRRKFTSR